MAVLRVPPVLDLGRLIEWLKEDLAPQVERSILVTHTFGSAANTSERIRHGLGAIPKAWYLVEKDRACDVYRSSTDQVSDERWFWLKCDTASAVVTIRVF